MVGLTRRQVAAGAAASAVAASAQARGRPAPTGRHVLWYAQPAEQWVEALPIGNGRLGAMIFGGVAAERLQLNEDTLWSGGPYDPVNPRAREGLGPVRAMIAEGRFAEAEQRANETLVATPPREMPYQPFGDLRIRLVGTQGAVSNYRRSLDLDDAVAETRFEIDGVHYTRRVLASPVDQVIAMELTASRSGALNFDLTLTSAQTVNQVVHEGRDTLKVSGRNNAEGAIPGGLTFCGRARLVTKGGAVSGADGQLSVRGTDLAIVYVAMATSYRRYDDVGGDPDAITRKQIASVAVKPFEQVARDAAAAHRALFGRVGLDLGGTTDPAIPTDLRLARNETTDDPALAELYFQYARYLLIACSRPGGQAANLQGLWNDQVKPPWGSNYTININTQMNYWPAEAGGLAECAEPLFHLIKDISERGATTARRMYDARGWVAHHNTDLWRGTAPFDHAKAGLWPTGGAWLCAHLWDRYDYGRDKRFLARAYPILKGASSVLPRHAADRLRDRLAGHQPVGVAGEPPRLRLDPVRGSDHGHADPARPVRPHARGGADPGPGSRPARGARQDPRPPGPHPGRRTGPADGVEGRLGRGRGRSQAPARLAPLWPLSQLAARSRHPSRPGGRRQAHAGDSRRQDHRLGDRLADQSVGAAEGRRPRP
jgi:alpha-L-fucosidase 2